MYITLLWEAIDNLYITTKDEQNNTWYFKPEEREFVNSTFESLNVNVHTFVSQNHDEEWNILDINLLYIYKTSLYATLRVPNYLDMMSNKLFCFTSISTLKDTVQVSYNPNPYFISFGFTKKYWI